MEMTTARDWADAGAKKMQRLGPIDSTDVLTICPHFWTVQPQTQRRRASDSQFGATGREWK